MQAVREEHHLTVRQLAARLREEYGLTEKEAVSEILALQSYGSLRLEEDPLNRPVTISGYLRSFRSIWYWLTVGLAAATALAVFAIPEGLYPLVYARYVLGSIFILWLPGYSFIKALFPTRVPVPTGKRELDGVERIALSAGMSLVLVPLVGLLLNYTPWGIRLTPVTLSLFALTITFATAGLLREQAAGRMPEEKQIEQDSSLSLTLHVTLLRDHAQP